jgi:hypothetical protein
MIHSDRSTFNDLVNLSARITKNGGKKIGVQTTPITNDIARQLFSRWC